MQLARFLPLFLLLISLTGTGCLFSPDKKPPKGDGGGPEYLDPVTPPAVLSNMIAAYVARDSVQTDSVYDASYLGESLDPSGIAGNYTTDRRAEVRHVGALRLDPTIIGVLLDMGSPALWQILPADAGDPAEWRVIQIDRATVSISTQGGSALTSTNQILTYTFIPTVESPTRTTWKIVHWKENVTNPPKP